MGTKINNIVNEIKNNWDLNLHKVGDIIFSYIDRENSVDSVLWVLDRKNINDKEEKHYVLQIVDFESEDNDEYEVTNIAEEVVFSREELIKMDESDILKLIKDKLINRINNKITK